MAKQITAELVASAEADLAAAKKDGDPLRLREAMDALAEVRSGWRAQEEAAGRRSGVVTTEV